MLFNDYLALLTHAVKSVQTNSPIWKIGEFEISIRYA